jgi:hypothetical protein
MKNTTSVGSRVAPNEQLRLTPECNAGRAGKARRASLRVQRAVPLSQRG